MPVNAVDLAWLESIELPRYRGPRRARTAKCNGVHAGPVLAADGSMHSATALRSVLAEAEMRDADTDRAWVTRIWSKLVPDGSAVAGLLDDVHP